MADRNSLRTIALPALSTGNFGFPMDRCARILLTEVYRYLVQPGQACSYKLGHIKMVELRERARQRLGERFDIRAFHDLVLGNGALPLTVLEASVEDWIATQAALPRS